MFFLTVDQVASRTGADRVRPALDGLRSDRTGRIRLGPDRTAGDEFELVARDARAALGLVLDLQRAGSWSVGLGVGPLEEPLPDAANACAGPATVAARAAVEAAKRAPHRFAVRASGAAAGAAAGVGALVDLLLEVRSRRSAEGWEVADLLDTAGSQTAVAERIGVTPQAVSLRSRAAGLLLERAALPALIDVLAGLDRSAD